MKNKEVLFYLIRERDKYCDQRCNEDGLHCDACGHPTVQAFDEAIEAVEMRKEE